MDPNMGNITIKIIHNNLITEFSNLDWIISTNAHAHKTVIKTARVIIKIVIVFCFEVCR